MLTHATVPISTCRMSGTKAEKVVHIRKPVDLVFAECHTFPQRRPTSKHALEKNIMWHFKEKSNCVSKTVPFSRKKRSYHGPK